MEETPTLARQRDITLVSQLYIRYILKQRFLWPCPPYAGCVEEKHCTVFLYSMRQGQKRALVSHVTATVCATKPAFYML